MADSEIAGAGAPLALTQPTPAEAARMNEADFEAWRQDFLRGFAEDLAELHRDPEAWAEYQAEGELTSVSDGVG